MESPGGNQGQGYSLTVNAFCEHKEHAFHYQPLIVVLLKLQVRDDIVTTMMVEFAARPCQ